MDFPSPKRRPTLAEMLGSTSEPVATTTAPAPKRRLTLQEMLKQSPLMGTPVSLPEAVASAQAAAARKFGGETVVEAPPEPTPTPPAVEISTPAVAPEPAPFHVAPPEPLLQVRAQIPPSLHAGRYNLYARIDGRWSWQCDIHADTHADAMRQAAAWLKPEHEAYPIRLEQDEVVRVAASA
jgi:hypothetical protein